MTHSSDWEGMLGKYVGLSNRMSSMASGPSFTNLNVLGEVTERLAIQRAKELGLTDEEIGFSNKYGDDTINAGSRVMNKLRYDFSKVIGFMRNHSKFRKTVITEGALGILTERVVRFGKYTTLVKGIKLKNLLKCF